MKNIIRAEQKQKRALLTKEDITLRSDLVISKIINDENYINSKVIALYYPINNEINLTKLFDISNKTYCLPKVNSDKTIDFVLYEKSQILTKSKLNIMEPISNEVISNIEYMIVPGLAVSKNKYRLGYGMGCYDKYLAQNRAKYVVGVFYDFQVVDNIYETENDQKLDYFFTC